MVARLASIAKRHRVKRATKRLQVRVLRWSYFLSLQDLTMGFAFVRTQLEKVDERGAGGEGQFGARMCAGAYVRRVVKRVCG